MEKRVVFRLSDSLYELAKKAVSDGKAKTVCSKDSDGNALVIKAYEFDLDKTRRVVRKYGHIELVTKLPTKPGSQRILSRKGMEKKSGESNSCLPQKLGNVSNSVTEKTHFRFTRLSSDKNCELCSKSPTEIKINDVKGEQILRRCKSCFEKMRNKFSEAIWKEEGKTNSETRKKDLGGIS